MASIVGRVTIKQIKTYTFTLTVYNKEGQRDIKEIVFTLPESTCPSKRSVVKGIKVFPNPAKEYLKVDYEFDGDDQVEIYGMHSLTGKIYGQFDDDTGYQKGKKSLMIDISQWKSGQNSLLFMVGNKVFVEHIIKE